MCIVRNRHKNPAKSVGSREPVAAGASFTLELAQRPTKLASSDAL